MIVLTVIAPTAETVVDAGDGPVAAVEDGIEDAAGAVAGRVVAVGIAVAAEDRAGDATRIIATDLYGFYTDKNLRIKATA